MLGCFSVFNVSRSATKTFIDFWCWSLAFLWQPAPQFSGVRPISQCHMMYPRRDRKSSYTDFPRYSFRSCWPWGWDFPVLCCTQVVRYNNRKRKKENQTCAHESGLQSHEICCSASHSRMFLDSGLWAQFPISWQSQKPCQPAASQSTQPGLHYAELAQLHFGGHGFFPLLGSPILQLCIVSPHQLQHPDDLVWVSRRLH